MKQLSNPHRKRWWQLFEPSQWLLFVMVVLISSSFIFSGIAKIFGGPEIVVYMDKDAKQPAILPLPDTKVVSGERAAFWWTVFNKANEHTSVSDARYIANDATDRVYGPPEIDLLKPQKK